ncbi:molybdopterin dinucleotide binding domain-containing protein [Agrobacterium tumefaciens]|uniref:molybdopterin dinucleotide binding domain-containing protein n=1 Tax=Agrobacterium tumefaciens TaxID=358 RepID=UPI003CE48ABF
MTRTGKSARLTAHIAEPFAELHPRDAQALGIESADLVELESPAWQGVCCGRWSVKGRRAGRSSRRCTGTISSPRGRASMCVVAPVTDPHSGQPASKNVAVRARRFAAKAYGFAISRIRPDAPDCAYWAIGQSRMAAIAWSSPLRRSRRTGRSGRGRSSASMPGSSRWVTATGRRAICVLPFSTAKHCLRRCSSPDEPVAVARNWAISQLD